MKVRKQGYLLIPPWLRVTPQAILLHLQSNLLPSSHSWPENTHKQREAGGCPFVQAAHSWTLAHLLQRWLLLSLRVPPLYDLSEFNLRCIEYLHYIMYQTGLRWVQRCIRYSSSTLRTAYVIHEKSKNKNHHRIEHEKCCIGATSYESWRKMRFMLTRGKRLSVQFSKAKIF